MAQLQTVMQAGGTTEGAVVVAEVATAQGVARGLAPAQVPLAEVTKATPTWARPVVAAVLLVAVAVREVVAAATTMVGLSLLCV